MAVKKLNDQQEQELIELYNQGLSTIKLSKKFALSSTGIAMLLRRKNVEVRKRSDYGNKLSTEQKLKAIEMYASGLTMKQIGIEFNTKYQTIKSILHANNIEIKDKSLYQRKLSEDDELEIIKLYPELSLKKIAPMFNVDYRTIQGVMRRHQIKALTCEDRRKLNPEQEKEVALLYQQGQSIYRLSKTFQMQKMSIKRIIKSAKVEIRSSGIPNISGELKVKNTRKIEQWEHNRIIELYSEGESMKDIAIIYEVNPVAISRILKKHEIASRKPIDRSLFNKRKTDKIINLYNNGNSSVKIGKLFKVSSSTISRLLKRNGIEIKGVKHFNKKLNDEQDSEVINLYEQGLSMNKVAYHLDTSTATIGKILKRNNIELRHIKSKDN